MHVYSEKALKRFQELLIRKYVCDNVQGHDNARRAPFMSVAIKSR